MTRARRALFSALLLALPLAAFEAGLRVYFHFFRPPMNRYQELSDELGWTTTRGARAPAGDGVFTTDERGFRRWGNVETAKKKVFVIGDSYTLARKVPDGQAYYDVLAKELRGVEIFAFGCAGYGSLQEYMIVDKYFDVIRPDLIVWQFCGNDLVNNSQALESRSAYHNNHMTRPYLIDGKVVRRYPARRAERLMRVLQRSYVFKLLEVDLGWLRAEGLGSIEDGLSPADPLYAEARDATDEIMGRVKKRVGGVPIVAFSADEPAWAGDVFREIARKRGIGFVEGIPARLERTEVPTAIGPGDPHWNAAGHRLVGEALAAHMKKGAAGAAIAGPPRH